MHATVTMTSTTSPSPCATNAPLTGPPVERTAGPTDSPCEPHSITKYKQILRTPFILNRYLQVKTIHGRGRGLFLRDDLKDIREGTLLLQENPLVTFEEDKGNQPRGLTRRMMEAEWKGLAEESKERLALLYWGENEYVDSSSASDTISSPSDEDHAPHANDCASRCELNSFTSSDNTNIHPVYWALSFMNHSCKPNVIYVLSDGSQNMEVRVYATRLIRDSEDELLTGYLSFNQLLLPTHKRQQRILDMWGFGCSCETCTPRYGAPGMDHGDKLRARARRLMGRKMLNIANMGPPNFDLKNDVEQLRAENAITEFIKLLEEFGFLDHLGNAHAHAAFIYGGCRDNHLRRMKLAYHVASLQVLNKLYNRDDTLQQCEFISPCCDSFLRVSFELHHIEGACYTYASTIGALEKLRLEDKQRWEQNASSILSPSVDQDTITSVAAIEDSDSDYEPT
jgi:hypothetical protein